MPTRPTVIDLAQAAGVSTATVDRVLNRRAGVADRTRLLVEEAARRIGYLPEAGGAPPLRSITIYALLPAGTNQYIADLRAHLLHQARALPGLTVEIIDLPTLTAPDLAAALLALPECAGVIVVALSHPSVREAIRRTASRRIPVVTLASDLPDADRIAYIGVDNVQAGRLAGQVIGRFHGAGTGGTVALFAGALAYRGHQEREMGLRQILSETRPDLKLLEVRESGEDRDRALAETRALLAAHSDLVAIYNAGGGTYGIATALEEAGRASDVILVAHEATEQNKALLLSGTLDAVLDQNVAMEAREALATLAANARGQSHAPIPPRLELILRENLPADTRPPI